MTTSPQAGCSRQPLWQLKRHMNCIYSKTEISNINNPFRTLLNVSYLTITDAKINSLLATENQNLQKYSRR